MRLYESDLVFDFDDSAWIIKKYDDHQYYNKLRGAGLKGVDFIGIYKQETVVFIEVKNFRDRNPYYREPFAVLKETNLFITKMADKLVDTFRATTAIAAFLRKKWWYRLFLKVEKFIPSQWYIRQDWAFWHIVHQLAAQRSNICFVLWLEIEERISDKGKIDLSLHIDKQLEKELAEFTDKVVVASVEQPVYVDDLKVFFEAQ